MRRFKGLAAVLGLYFGMFLLIFYSGELASGIRNGIRICFDFLIPSLFLFMICSNYLIASPLRRWIARPFRFLGKFVFRLEDNLLAIVILSLIGGYPVGAKLLSDAVSRGELLPAQAERMLTYCVNCGPAFLIGGIGSAIFGSLQIGLFLCLSQIGACILLGFFQSFSFGKVPHPSSGVPQHPAKKHPAVLLVSSVQDAARALGIICSFVLAFSAFLPLLRLILQQAGIHNPVFLQGMLEVTSGCALLSECHPSVQILLAAFFTAFGGICVHLQIAAMLSGSGIRMRQFYLWRIPYCIASVGITWLLLHFFPQAEATIRYNHTISQELSSATPLAALFLMLLCILLLFFSGKHVTLKKKSQPME